MIEVNRSRRFCLRPRNEAKCNQQPRCKTIIVAVVVPLSSPIAFGDLIVRRAAVFQFVALMFHVLIDAPRIRGRKIALGFLSDVKARFSANIVSPMRLPIELANLAPFIYEEDVVLLRVG